MKMKPIQLAVYVATAVLGFTTQSYAAIIVWNPATTIVDDSDVSITGTSLYAARFYSGTGASLTINTVTFTDPGSNVTWGGQTQNGIGSATGTTGNYATFLSSDSYNGGPSLGSSGTLNLNNLISGQEYMVQLWSSDSRNGAYNQLVTFTAGNAVSLNRNTTGTSNTGSGQWVIGTFTADAVTQVITVNNNLGQGLALNGLQVRTIPEPSAALLGGLGMLALLRRRRA